MRAPGHKRRGGDWLEGQGERWATAGGEEAELKIEEDEATARLQLQGWRCVGN